MRRPEKDDLRLTDATKQKRIGQWRDLKEQPKASCNNNPKGGRLMAAKKKAPAKKAPAKKAKAKK
jgi:hypothetical protein